ncbi:MAG: radical SAM protein [Candidatus Margulisbacteria bacterium]|jgi:putative pyruvate formate lyase activating enzyme|nr:radical SAM protein [Candidatus Margulisiibacteriota bacterium]
MELAKLFALAENCRLCPRQCGVNRLAGARGFCRAGNTLLVSYCGKHDGEEPPISGRAGSGTVFLGHCTMACVFCQNWQISRGPVSPAAAPDEKNPAEPHGRLDKKNILKALTPAELAAEFLKLQKSGAHNINLVSPTQYAPWIMQAVATARQNGLSIPIVYNTNGYERAEVLELLGGLVDIYLPDLKYASAKSAEKYSHTPDYPENARAAIKIMLKQKGLLQTRADIATQGIIVRHLVLPGLAAESKKILDWLSALEPRLSLSLMSQYAPQDKARQIPELNRRLPPAEYNEVVEYAARLGLSNVWTQEASSQEILVPDFRRESPFNNL